MDDPPAEYRPPDAASPSAACKISLLDGRSRPLASGFDAVPSICRICRSEGTAAEPLFYPCKCSGSIKYVHQDCLMEWLSHSQKKYCELCKTSFRFTKLYDPDMPKSLPVDVFLEHLVRSLFRNLLVWLRALVAVSVWAFWLPYLMRSVWSFMFWVSDEGLGSPYILSRANHLHAPGTWRSPSIVVNLATCPASPLLAAATTTAPQASTILDNLNGEDFVDYFLRVLLGALGMPTRAGRSEARLRYDASALQNASFDASTVSSLFGDVHFLRKLTRSPTLLRAVVKVLEGQVITVLVIVCFILVILVRDYVLQQQPEINMRAAFDEPDNLLPEQADEAVQPPALEPLREGPGPQSDDETLDDGGHQVRAAGMERPSTREIGSSHTRQAVSPRDSPRAESPFHLAENTGASEKVSPRDSLPTSYEPALGPEEQPSVKEYLRIYRRAGGDSERILQIVEEGLEDKLGYWVNVTRRSITEREDLGREHNLADCLHSPLLSPQDSVANVSPVDQALTPASNETDPAAPPPMGSGSKGKEREYTTVSPDIVADAQPPASSSRPHNGSNGLQHGSPGPNNWSFADLPPDSRVNGAAEPSPPAYLSTNADSPSSPLDDARIHLAAANQALQDVDAGQAPHSGDDADDSTLPRTLVAEQVPGEEPTPDDVEPAGLVGRVAEFMWGDLSEHHDVVFEGEDDPNEDDPDDDPWVDVPMIEGVDDNSEGDIEDLDDAAAGAGLDPEDMDDLEDFEGVMELVGMHGPIAGLFQNAIFCAVLVSVTIFACIFVPYNIGRVTLWVVANPIQLARELVELSRVVQDAAIMIGGLSSWFVLNLLDMFTSLIGRAVGARVVSARKASWGLWKGAGSRVMEYALMDFPMSASDMQNFSAISHEALIFVKASVAASLGKINAGFAAVTSARFYTVDGSLLTTLATAATLALANTRAALSRALDPSSWVIELGGIGPRPPIDPSLAHWSGLDQLWAILAGYLTIFAVSFMYLKRGTPFARGNMIQAWEAGIIDTLHQASGIMKVILIISIEMLVFPLYCGLLLDAASLPLFEDATVKSRLLFTYNFPLTSVFVHWFVGTGYMFHFALFVSMCRKIMRPGVLCACLDTWSGRLARLTYRCRFH